MCTLTFGENIHIAVASNMGYAIHALTKKFLHDRSDDTITVTLASSGQLSAQIQSGAPYALFLSADMRYAQELYDKGYGVQKPISYAKGVLVMFSRKKRDFTKGVQLLTHNNIHKIAIANPKTAPYGKASVEVFKNSSFYEQIRSKLVYAQSISQTLSFALHAAEIGFIAKSALYDKSMQKYKKNENYIEVEPKLYSPLKQGMILVKKYANHTLSKEFFKFLQSKQAKEVLKEYGYFVNE